MAAWVAGAAVLVVWNGVLLAGGDRWTAPEAYVVYYWVNLTVHAVAGLVAGAVASRRGTRFGRSILTGALLAVVSAAFAGAMEWTSKPSILFVPQGPRAAPIIAFVILVLSAPPCAVGAAVGWGVARRSARHST